MRHFIILASILFLVASCKEIAPEIPCLSCDNGGGTINPEDKVVLIEEFTGVQCVNCPAGSAEIENLLAIHGKRMVAVSIHAGFFAEKFDNSNFDFKTQETENVQSFLGEPEGYPSAVVDRKIFSGEPDLQVSQQSWAGYIAQQLQQKSPINMKVQNTFNASSRQLTAAIEVISTEDLSNQDLALTAYITENNITDPQLTPAGVKNDYKHKHVLRKVLGPFSGESIKNSWPKGQVRTYTYSFTLPATWKSENCYVVAFVHKAVNSKEVIQATEVAIQ